MILVRDVFQLKFGKARDAVAVWKEGRSLLEQSGTESTRLLTDLIGPYYTLVLERTYESLADFEQSSEEFRANDEWKAWYERFLPLLAGGHREVFNVVG